MLLKIAVVEDEQKVFEGLKEFLDRFAASNKIEIEVSYFSDAVKFLDDYKPVYHLVFMDINLPYMDGLTASHKLREFDSQVFIIFVTDLKQYAIKGYEVDALDYIVKPVVYDHLELKLQKVVNILNKRSESHKIPIKTDDGTVAVAVEDIRYIEVVNHYLYYHTCGETFKGYGSLSKIQKILPPDLFSRCNECYLVNLRFVTRIEKNNVYLGKTALVMSRMKKKGFLTAFTKYLGCNS